jgi:hypothetical protein
LGNCVQDSEALNTLKWRDTFEYQSECSISVRGVLHVAVYSCVYMQCLTVLSSSSEPVNVSNAANNCNFKKIITPTFTQNTELPMISNDVTLNCVYLQSFFMLLAALRFLLHCRGLRILLLSILELSCVN